MLKFELKVQNSFLYLAIFFRIHSTLDLLKSVCKRFSELKKLDQGVKGGRVLTLIHPLNVIMAFPVSMLDSAAAILGK